MHAGGRMCTHAGGVEWSAGEVHDEEEEGLVHTLALSLGQPDIFGPAKGFRSRVGGWQEPVGLCRSCHPGWQQLSQGSAQLGDGVVKLGGGKGYK